MCVIQYFVPDPQPPGAGFGAAHKGFALTAYPAPRYHTQTMSGHNVSLAHKSPVEVAQAVIMVSGHRGDLKVVAILGMAMPRSALGGQL
jgi:hypothetical protein